MGKEKDVCGNYYSDWNIEREDHEIADKENSNDSDNESTKSEDFICSSNK